MPNFTRLAAGWLALTLALAGCGSSASPAASTSAAPNASATVGSSAPGASGGSGVGGAGGAAPPSAAASGGNLAEQLQQQFVSVIQKVSPAVVVIQTSSGLGSGVVFDSQGNIVTNAHVVGSATRFNVTTSDGKSFDGRLVGSFPADDIAVIKVTGQNVQPATFGDSSKLVVGDIVMAIGNPLGLQSSVTEGIVSAVGRTVTEPGGASLPNVIQTSAPINPGNSGGALVDLEGEVVGIPTLAAVDTELGGTAPGIGFAIPSNLAKDIATQLIQNGKVVSSHRAYLGIRAANVTGGGGVLVYAVTAGGPAARAGIKPGELITSIAGQRISDVSVLSAALAGLAPGKTVPVEIVRPDGTKATVQVTLGELPG